MIDIQIPDKVSYDELVIRTITNISIKQLCHYSEALEDLIQAYDLKEKRVNKKKITSVDEYYIRNLETKYNVDLHTIADTYEEYYKYLAFIETASMSKTFKYIHKTMLARLDEIMTKNGLAIS